MQKICNKAKECREANNTNGRCPHLRIHGYDVECDKKLKEAYGWKDGLGCYYFPDDQECVEIC